MDIRDILYAGVSKINFGVVGYTTYDVDKQGKIYWYFLLDKRQYRECKIYIKQRT